MEALLGQGQGRYPDGKVAKGCLAFPTWHPSAGGWSYRIHKHRNRKTVCGTPRSCGCLKDRYAVQCGTWSGGGGKTSRVRQADSEFPVPIPWFPNRIKEQSE